MKLISFLFSIFFFLFFFNNTFFLKKLKFQELKKLNINDFQTLIKY